jgi:hypothetical protein
LIGTGSGFNPAIEEDAMNGGYLDAGMIYILAGFGVVVLALLIIDRICKRSR